MKNFKFTTICVTGVHKEEERGGGEKSTWMNMAKNVSRCNKNEKPAYLRN